MNDCRLGKRVAVDGSGVKEVIVELGVEIGLMTTVELNCDKGEINFPELQEQVKEKVIDMFDIDGRDKVLNNVCIYAVQ